MFQNSWEINCIYREGIKIIKKNMYDLQYILAILTFVLAMLTQH